MTKIKEILQTLKEGNYLLSQEQLDTAASAIEKAHDEEMVECLAWASNNYTILGLDEWQSDDDGKRLSTAQLLHLYKNKMIMPDITMCEGFDCPIKNECYRFRAKPSEHRQSYWADNPRKNGECQYFAPLTGWPEHQLTPPHLNKAND